jgi:hypothetical protein
VHGLRGTIVITVDDKPIGVQRKRRGRKPKEAEAPPESTPTSDFLYGAAE